MDARKSIHCPRCKTVIALPEKRPEGPEPTVGIQVKPVAGYDSSALTRVDDGSLAKQVADELSAHDGGLSELDDQAIASAIDAFRNTNEHEKQTDATAFESGYVGANSDPLSSSSNSVTDSLLSSRPQDWNSPATKRRRQLLMIAMAGVAGLLLAIGSLAAFIAARSGIQSKMVKEDSGKETLPIVAPVETKADEPTEVVVKPIIEPTEKLPGPSVETPAETIKPVEPPTATVEPITPISPGPEPSTACRSRLHPKPNHRPAYRSITIMMHPMTFPKQCNVFSASST